MAGVELSPGFGFRRTLAAKNPHKAALATKIHMRVDNRNRLRWDPARENYFEKPLAREAARSYISRSFFKDLLIYATPKRNQNTEGRCQAVQNYRQRQSASFARWQAPSARRQKPGPTAFFGHRQTC
jgi:hypothetical protein